MDIVNAFYSGREMLRIQDVADRLGLHINTVHRYAREGRIPLHEVPNVGRVFDWAEVQEWYAEAKKIRPAQRAELTDSQIEALRKAACEATIARAEAALQAVKDRYAPLSGLESRSV